MAVGRLDISINGWKGWIRVDGYVNRCFGQEGFLGNSKLGKSRGDKTFIGGRKTW